MNKSCIKEGEKVFVRIFESPEDEIGRLEQFFVFYHKKLGYFRIIKDIEDYKNGKSDGYPIYCME